MVQEKVKHKLKNIISCGEIYFEVLNKDYKYSDLMEKDFVGMKFFLEHVLMRGRKDELSIQYFEIIRKIFQYEFYEGDMFNKNKFDSLYLELEKDFESVTNEKRADSKKVLALIMELKSEKWKR